MATEGNAINQGSRYKAIADTDATLSCITEGCVWKNESDVIGPEIMNRKVKTILRLWFESEFLTSTEFFVLKQLDGTYPNYQVEASKGKVMHLGLADPNFDVHAPINVILGAEMYALIIGTDLYRHECGEIMQSTELDHIVLGKFVVDLPILNVMQSNEKEKIQKALTKIWEIDEINKSEYKQLLSEEGILVEKLFLETHYRDPCGRRAF